MHTGGKKAKLSGWGGGVGARQVVGVVVKRVSAGWKLFRVFYVCFDSSLLLTSAAAAQDKVCR